ncbi:MAG: Succinate dehydrogenase cytochrome b558 subunit [Chlamydiales bacterium]|nr:Succinate dehydrogenase cytochrome b558 subunit [Chlamydiales bacterium]MCH9619447.1 Succinate dehydrogenase cytochrome b558 subunit [Chlamydiales bacterium]MCH9622251.1 Succinate dehydrogenase cytochrome b558 subunit [Chlamydiales bacterium]
MATPANEKVFETDQTSQLPRTFVFRRLHSLLGLWLSLYLCEHLLVNSQAALLFRDGGYGFVRSVNAIHKLPYLKVIEVTLLGLPFLFHAIWGIGYLWSGKFNSFKTDGKSPSLPQYRRNRWYTWQRITSWVLLIGIIGHVVQMRFIHYPLLTKSGDEAFYTVRVKDDPGIFKIAQKLDIELEPGKGESLIATAPSAGAAFLLVVRETMKDPLMVILYSIFVVAAAFHAFNGLWTFLITWGIAMTRRSQMRMRGMITVLMAVVIVLGLMAVWGPYWTQLFQR